MKKRFAAVFAATAVLGVTTAFAANPFSDVTPSDWAYQSVSQLAAAGVINGYPDGTFQGQKNITRYEMAQMVAKAMANEARANAEQQAMINRLADEFSSELNNLGVRVANLENKVGNVKVTGDVRLRYMGSKDSDDYKGKFANSENTSKESKFDFRGRLQFNATVNENTNAVVRVTTGNTEFGDASSSDVEFDRMYVNHKFGNHVSANVGRMGLFVGQGLIYDDTFDGATVTAGTDKVSLTVGHGYLLAGDAFSMPGFSGFGLDELNTDENLSYTLFQLNGKLANHTDLSAFYLKNNKTPQVTQDYVNSTLSRIAEENIEAKLDNDIYGFGFTSHFNKVWLSGEYATFKDDVVSGADLDKDAWTAGIGYGDYDLAKAGTWDVKVQYFDLGETAPVISSTWNQPYNSNYKTWMATVDYALAKNVGLSAYATFGAEDQQGNDAPDFYRAELNYKF